MDFVLNLTTTYSQIRVHVRSPEGFDARHEAIPVDIGHVFEWL